MLSTTIGKFAWEDAGVGVMFGDAAMSIFERSAVWSAWSESHWWMVDSFATPSVVSLPPGVVPLSLDLSLPALDLLRDPTASSNSTTFGVAGGSVTSWIDCNTSPLAELISASPSCSSRRFGKLLPAACSASVRGENELVCRICVSGTSFCGKSSEQQLSQT